MINPLSTYVEAGRKAAEARNHGDEACAKFHADCFRRAKALETGEDRVKACEAYQHGYKLARHVPTFKPFR